MCAGRVSVSSIRMKLRLLLPVPVLAMATLLHCGSDDDGSSFVPLNGDGGEEGSSGNASGFVPVTCDGAPCPADDGGSEPIIPSCSDGTLAKSEACDDGNTKDGDGCSATCTLESGYACPTPGLACTAAKCGDGILAGSEECEFTDATPPTGCGTDCKIAAGYDCDPVTHACKEVKCGDGVVSRGETCEDGNTIPFDGCYNCQKDPVCSNGVCQAACGDGQKFAGEDCDDGNTRDGDGCSKDCKIETGFKCTDIVGQPPATIELPLLVRDFIGRGNALDGATSHPDFNDRGGSGILKMVEPNLGPNGRMVPNCPGGDCTKNPAYNEPSPDESNFTTAANFNEWYVDNDKNIKSVVKLTLKRAGDAYVWDSGDNTQNPNGPAFFDPIGDGGWVAKGKEKLVCDPVRNASWTTETHFFFEYQGGEEFAFSGDDDTWVFVNGHLALDLGGLHTPRTGTVKLDASSGNGKFTSDLGDGDLTLGLTKGGIYEIVMFQAERNECGSNFKVTFRGFNKPKSECASTCGDGVRASDEVCDDGKNDGRYGGCMPGCKARGPRCGDGTLQEGEECDDGNSVNDDTCSNGCKSLTVK